MSSGSPTFGKTICSICYEDFNPILEDLQVISICGHVFHELCLQQWLEYCPAGKKTSCPICKQFCSQKNICRLYFQSTGDSATQTTTSPSPKTSDADAEALHQEVKKLEMKISGLNSAFENQQQHIKELNAELTLSKACTMREEKLKEEALMENLQKRQLLQMKTEELNRSSAECSRLQERSMNLAKELGALKLVSDVNLEEEEVLKLASIGGGSNKEQTIDVLKKSLILRNKSYRELMTQCNLLGRGETRSLKKLEKAEEKIKKLKTRLQELERALEEKDNKFLRTLKASKRNTMEDSSQTTVKSNANPSVMSSPSEDDMERPVKSAVNHEKHSNLRINNSLNSTAIGVMSEPQKVLGAKSCKETKDVIDLDLETDCVHWIDDDTPEISASTPRQSGHSEILIQTKFCKGADQKFGKANSGASFTAHMEASVHGGSGSVGCLNPSTKTEIDRRCKLEGAMDEDVLHVSNPSLPANVLLPGIIMENKSLLPVKRETPEGPEPIIRPGDQCVPGGLGSDGTKKYAGKWSRRAQSKISSSEGNVGDLIAVGADGRGGRIKVLRAQNQLDGRGSSLWPKRCKYGTKESQSQGCLQIEHFFVKREGSEQI